VAKFWGQLPPTCEGGTAAGDEVFAMDIGIRGVK